jgi:hypothetical protein
VRSVDKELEGKEKEKKKETLAGSVRVGSGDG